MHVKQARTPVGANRRTGAGSSLQPKDVPMELPPPGGAWRRVEERPVLWSWMRWALLICARGNIADQGRHAGVRSRKDQRQKTGCRVPRSSIRPMRPHAPAPRLLEPPSAAGGGFFSAPPAGGHARSPGAGQRFPVESPPPLRARALPLLQAPCELPGRRSHVGHAACRLSGCLAEACFLYSVRAFKI